MLVVEARLVEIIEFLWIDNYFEDVPVKMEDCIWDYPLVVAYFKCLLKHTFSIWEFTWKASSDDIVFGLGSIQLNDFDFPVFYKAFPFFRVLISQSFVNFAEMILIVI